MLVKKDHMNDGSRYNPTSQAVAKFLQTFELVESTLLSLDQRKDSPQRSACQPLCSRSHAQIFADLPQDASPAGLLLRRPYQVAGHARFAGRSFGILE